MGSYEIRNMASLTSFKIFVLEVILNIALHFIGIHVSGLQFVIIKIVLKSLFKLYRDWMEENF